MPEIWLSYGATDVVLDVRAENLGPVVGPAPGGMGPGELAEALGALDLSGPVTAVALHSTAAVHEALSSLAALCAHRSAPAPRVMADRGDAARMRAALPEGTEVAELAPGAPPPEGAVFFSETELDGLFGYETASTRLLRRYGGERMLSAYAARRGNAPAPGRPTPAADEAGSFADGLGAACVELAGCAGGVLEARVGRPSEAARPSPKAEAAAVREAGRHRALVVSPGKEASGLTLGRALCSLWGSAAAVEPGGMAVLVAECGRGLGSEAMRRFIEGRLDPGALRSPPEYVQGMEDLLFLREALGAPKAPQVGLVSVLPELYARKLGLVPLGGARAALEYALKAHGPRQKVAVVTDGARALLR